MKKTFLVLILSVIHAGSLYATCKTEACKRAVAWKSGYTAIVLQDDITPADYLAILDAVKSNQGIVAIEAERALLGWIPRTSAAKIRGAHGVRTVSYDVVARPDDLVRNENARAALSFFNHVIAGEYEDAVEKGLTIHGEPLTGCIVERPASLSLARAQGIPSFSGESPSSPRLGRVGANFWFRTPYQNPDMRGRVTVQVFRLDSDGRVDPNLYTWTDADFAYARDQVYAAYTFWVNQASAHGVTLSFRISIEDPLSHYSRKIVPTSTRYEPITRSSNDDYLWVNDALWFKGYDSAVLTPENVYSQNEAFNRFRAADPYGPYDRSFSVYLVYNPGAAPSVFANGQRAYAMYDGPFTMMMWNSAGWQPQNINLVLTHESGHIFWACDEYYDVPSNTGCFSCAHCFYNVGPRNQLATPWITNANCDYSTTGCDIPRIGCMMKDLSNGLCSHTPGQLGW
jgi:hypothetical protein